MDNKEIFYEVAKEAREGYVSIDGDPFPICFNTKGIDFSYEFNKDYPVVTINDKEQFFNYLDIYIEKELKLNRKHPKFVRDEDKNFRKMLISYLFVNGSITDFENPINMLRRNISFLDNNVFDNFSSTIKSSSLLDSEIVIKNEVQSIMMETKNLMTFNLVSENDYYTLPSISYGIDNETCYIYSIMQDKRFDNKDGTFRKKINRLLYKLNEGVMENESLEYKNYKDGFSDYYPENVSDISLSFLLSLSLFIRLLESKNISNVKVITYLPLRYLSRDEVSIGNSDLEKRNDLIQENATNKLIRTFLRCAYHINGIEVLSLPYEIDEYLNIKIKNTQNINNELLNDTIRKI